MQLQVQKENKRFTHWTCSYCRIIIPDYKRSWYSLETKIKNHLQKFHFNSLTDVQIRDLLKSLWTEYKTSRQ